MNDLQMQDMCQNLQYSLNYFSKTQDYIDWLFPGIIAMNMMFSSLYGVGYVIILYRKNGTLKRLKATPLTAFEYLAAQVVSRIFLVVFTSFVVYAGCALIFNFQCRGSYLDLIFIFTLGSASVISLVIASRSSSEEFANGVVNIVAWPMMFLSEVWFSVEGSPEWVRTASQFFPLTHMTEGLRRIMNQGADIGELAFEVTVLLMTTLFMTAGSFLFKWTKD
ncbi:MAG: ABC transporter permease [Desulfobacteraceae bacterium]|nr:ABC transporter permease [Desulfobacteraceae bacterium]